MQIGNDQAWINRSRIKKHKKRKMKGTRLFNGKGKAGKQREHTFPSPYITSTELLYRKGIRDKFNFNGVKGALELILKRRKGNQEAVAKRRAIKPY